MQNSQQEGQEAHLWNMNYYLGVTLTQTVNLMRVDKRGLTKYILSVFNKDLCICKRPSFLAHRNKGTENVAK